MKKENKIFKEVLKRRYGLNEDTLERVLKHEPSKEKVINVRTKRSIRFAAIGDTHLGSKEEALNELRAFYKILKKRKINVVLHAGDILDGQNVYYGQEFELAVFGADNQIEYAVKHYPRVNGIITYFITGNHDYGFYKRMGLDVGKSIANQRDDMVYLGQTRGEIKIGGVKIWLVHPDGGMPYALSYRAQKYVEQISSGSKPQIILFGHLHTQYHFDYRNISVFGVGCFQGQTSFILRKGINPVIGGWIITAYLADDAKHSIVRVVPEFIKLRF